MAKNTFKIISLVSIIVSALFVILNIIIERATYYNVSPPSCSGACSLFSTLSLIFTLGGFVLAIVLKIISRKNAEIEGKKVISLAITLNIVLFFVWVLTYFGLFIPSY